MDQELGGRRYRFLFYVIMLSIPLTTAYICFTIYRTFQLYSYVKTNQRGWSGKVHQSDADLGFAPVPDSQGAHIFPIGPDIPMRYDANGFRVPVNYIPLSPTRPTMLVLGCSFTYGDANYAEDTYPYLIGQYLGGTAYNAGVCSYGLSQMLILGKRLVPLHKPDYIIAQYSPWLVERSLSPFAPTYFSRLPTPYFYGNEALTVYPPIFQTILMDIPTEDKYRRSPKNIIDFILFQWDVGLPLYLHDDANMAFYVLKKGFGFIPKPTSDGPAVVEYVYKELAKTATENNAKLIIVVLGDDHHEVPVPHHLFPKDAVVVDAHQYLLRNLPVVNRDTYIMSYAIWRELQIVDSHPNKKAHKIIAEKIADAVKVDWRPALHD